MEFKAAKDSFRERGSSGRIAGIRKLQTIADKMEPLDADTSQPQAT
jgi:hypothetical protein